MPHNLPKLFLVTLLLLAAGSLHAESLRLPVTADIWLSDATPAERNSSMGASPRLKLKSIQELAALRFDAAPLRGLEVKSARLFLRKASDDGIRYLRLSTINQDWVEGKSEKSYGPADGANWFFADANAKTPWAWPGSGFCDVILTSGHSLASYAEKREEKDGWISVEVAPTLVYALAIGDSDGLAVMDGGNLALHNNFFYSHEQNQSAPYLQVETGGKLAVVPAAPKFQAAPAPDAAHLTTGALRIQIDPDPAAFCYRLTLNGQPLPRWQVPHPKGGAPAMFLLDDLIPNKQYKVEITTIAPSGQTSPPTILTVAASPELPAPPILERPVKPSPVPDGVHKDVLVLPPLVKLSPDPAQPLNDDLEDKFTSANSVWNGRSISLASAKGEYVSFQLLAPGQQPAITVSDLIGVNPVSRISAAANVELSSLHIAQNRDKQPQPAYAIPLAIGDKSISSFVHVDLFIPKDAQPGRYTATLTVAGAQRATTTFPIELTVYDFALPDELSFWPELNGYSIPKNHLDYYRLAHQHRCVANFWRFAPIARGKGEQIRVDWTAYDRDAGPLLSGQAFQNTRRPGIPAECMYLPYADNWPTNLTPETYHYPGHWPGRGEDKKFLVDHSLTAPPIDQALSPDYLAAFAAVQTQFTQHFKQQGWNRTEMQCYFGGKQAHRINFGSNLWWTTDEPSFLHDWLALQFFDRLWTGGATSHLLWPTRADISRPHWQGDFLDGVTQVIYYGAGAASSPEMIHRIQTHARTGPFKVRFYGSCNPDNQSNLVTVAWLLDAYLNGADGALPWQTLGSEKALDSNDAGAFGGNALLVPATRYNQSVVADLRLKAMRDAEQLIEYLHLLGQRRHLNREQLKSLVAQHLPPQTSPAALNPTADTDHFTAPKEWQIANLRQALAKLIIER